MSKTFKMKGKIDGFKITYYEDEKENGYLSYNDTIKVIDNLQKQLQSYRDKKDRLRYCIATNTRIRRYVPNLTEYNDTEKLALNILQILNEGGKK